MFKLRCVTCSTVLTGSRTKFCSRKCIDKDYYQKNKHHTRLKVQEWQTANPDKKRLHNQKAMKKYYLKNRDSHIKRMIAYHQKMRFKK